MNTTLLLDENILFTILRHLQIAVVEDIKFILNYKSGTFFRPYDKINCSVFDTIVDNLLAYNAVFPGSRFRSLKRIKKNLYFEFEFEK